MKAWRVRDVAQVQLVKEGFKFLWISADLPHVYLLIATYSYKSGSLYVRDTEIVPVCLISPSINPVLLFVCG